VLKTQFSFNSAQLTVTLLPNILVQTRGGVHKVVAGSVVQLYCKASSKVSAPNVVWIKDGVILVSDPPHIRIRSSISDIKLSASSSLIVDNFGVADNGRYSCQANDGTRSTNSSTLSFTGT